MTKAQHAKNIALILLILAGMIGVGWVGFEILTNPDGKLQMR